jgi:ubiquinone/menaquinone biosynthesis C-methylase UbiE
MIEQESLIKDSISRRWDISSAAYDSHHGHGIKSDEERAAWKMLLTEVLGEGPLRILDVGCGTGEISLLLAEMGHTVHGLDLSEKMMDRGREKAAARGLAVDFTIGDAENPPFAEGSFDAVINRHVLWTLPNPQEAVRAWNRVLRPGGRAVIIDGIWDDGSLETRMRRLLSDVLIFFVDGRNPARGRYTDGISLSLPNAGGTPPERTREYLTGAGFRDLNTIELKELIEIQRRRMPFRSRISYTYRYFLVSGQKQTG